MQLEKTVIDSKKGIGLVLSGGGAMGAYEAGVIKGLKEAGIKFNLAAGTSVGILNGALVAADKIDSMINIWENIHVFQVLGFDPKTWGAGALLSNAPLEKLIRKEIDEEATKKIINSAVKLMVISSCLQDEKEVVAKDFKNREQIIKSLMSSCAIPLAFPFQLYLDKESIRQLVDGGLINNFPIKEAVKENLCKTFFTTSLYTPESRMPDDKERHYHGLIHIALRALDIIFASSYIRDISWVREKIERANKLKNIIETGFHFHFSKGYKKIKNLYKEEECEIYEGIQIVEINPKRRLHLDILDFYPKKTKLAVKIGYEDALMSLENIKII